MTGLGRKYSSSYPEWLEHNRRVADFSTYFDGRRADRWMQMTAEIARSRGKRCRYYDLAVRPLMAFFKFYVLKGGFRDGLFGLIMAQQAAISVQMKYASLWAVQHCDSPVDGESCNPSPTRGDVAA